MSPFFTRALPACGGILLMLVLVGSATGQAPKPEADGPKPPVHKPEQSALNRLKQDDRSKKALSDVIEQLRETSKRSEAAEKELKRVTATDLKDDPARTVDSVKDKLSAEDTAKLRAVLEKSKEVLNSEDAKKLAAELKKKAAASIKPKSSPTTSPPEKFGPSTFDKVPAPAPATPQAVTVKRRTPGFFVDGDSIIFPPTRDPAKPERVLPASDPRSRTYIVIGNAQVKTASMVLDGDRIEMVASAEGGGINVPQPAPRPTKSKAGDPVQPGIGGDGDEKKPAPFDRVLATGRVDIVRIINGKSQTGKGGSMIYDKKSGTMILTDWPQAQVEGKVITGKSKDAKIILVPNGEPRVENCRIEGFDAPATPAPSSGTTAAAPPPPKAKVIP